ncbi:MAG: type II secretion system F family protein [Acetobacteraceae bacterium]|nr:type II secretion system F family protein [Acetobacteraceae bacterium]
MSQGALLGCAALVAAVCLLAGIAALREVDRERRIRRRLGAFGPDRQVTRVEPGRLLLGAVAGFGSVVARSGLLPAKTRAELEQSLQSAGLRGRNGLGLFLGSKLLLFVGAPLLAIGLLNGTGIAPALSRIIVLGAAVAGLLLPDTILRRSRRNYLDRLEGGVPDALDMLVICAQAGLSLEPALERVAREIGHAHVEMARELEQTIDELRLAVDARGALLALGERTRLDSLRRVTSTLAQTLQYGTPLTEALRSLSAEMRQLSLTRFEERAARLPVLLTLPMILFIFPCVFIVIGGPAVLHIMKAFSH